MATANQLDDITECPICTEVYTDPRVLPCVHTYCLKCIREWSKGKHPGDELACPLCRKEFTLSSNGVDDLPRNVFVTNLLEIKQLTSVESKTSGCEACSDSGEEATEVKVATVYCVECQQKLCQACKEEHKKFRITSRHKIVELGSESLSLKLPFSTCEKHVDKYLEIFCFDCKLAICMICHINTHNKHKCSGVNEIAGVFQEQMASDVMGKMTDGVSQCREILAKIEKEKNDFTEQIAKAEMEISEKAEQLKRMIDVHKAKLVEELSSMKQKRMKWVESLREKIERQLLSMESYKKYVNEVRQKGTACNIERSASGLHDRADELLNFDDDIKRTLHHLGHADVMFTSSDFVVDDVNKTLGQLRQVVKFSPPRLTHVIPYIGRVTAVTSLGDEVFIARSRSQRVEVYDANTCSFQRCITIPGPRDSWQLYGLAACAHYQCLYASDWTKDRIYRVELIDGNAVKKWSVAPYGGPIGLSVNKAHNVVVACTGANKVLEYTTHGTLVREISLHDAVTKPWHAVQLSTGDYVVSQHIMSPGAVSIVGAYGQLVRHYRPSDLSGLRQMKCPTSLAVTKNDDILVAYAYNNRILSLNSSLGSAHELVLPVDGGNGIERPRGLCLDESRGRLYIGEGWGQCRVLVFDDVLL